ncbi:MAG: TetR/AcrR family transcriptional regulator [Clostridia bacterium]|nr:TetR/AcrR family transcriptional regulator [Clostridia bacterium]
MKIDARTKYSIKIIKETFIKMINENPVNKVTVKKLCEEAEINRATFYRYYEDIYDLYEKVKDEIIEVFFENFVFADFPGTEKDLENLLTEIKKNPDAVYAIARQSDALEFMKKFGEKVYFRFGDVLKDFYSDLSESQRKTIYYYMSFGCTGIIGEWIQSGMEADEKEIAHILTMLINNTLRKTD